ncbi:MAG: cell division protein FtsZ [Patescibacteria group bacterium]|nr:MAG: cell division protein FtsZ [Patescibacteria group bacterium]
MLVKPNAGQPAKISVIGVGGGGGNAISSMIKTGGITGVSFIAVNTDSQALLANEADIKIQIGEEITRGLGSGGNPEIGRQAAEESIEKIKEELTGSDMVFITAGMGGGTGTGAAPVIARIAKEMNILTVAVVTKPFEFEGKKRSELAEEGIESLKENVDTLIIVPNQRVLQIIDKKTSIIDAFKKIDSILYQGVKAIAELITLPGLINVDFADVKSVMENAGTSLMGIGVGSGDKRAISAVKEAISSPLIDVHIEGAEGVLFNIVGGPDISMMEIDEAANLITKSVSPNANIIFGAVIDENLVDEIKITIIATRFSERRINSFNFSSRSTTTQSRQKPEPEDIANLTSQTEEQKFEEEILEEDIDDNQFDSELDVPAFLRRKK